MKRTIGCVAAAGIVALCLGQGCPRNTGGFGTDTTNGNSANGTDAGANRNVVPGSLTLDISEFPEDESPSSGHGLEDQLTTPGGRYCALGHTVLRRFHFLLDEGLRLGAALNRDLADLEGTTLAGSFQIGRRTVPYKADFAAFDIDGDGAPDGSGRPDALPTALRLWIDPEGSGEFVRFLCTVVTVRPSTDNAGAGQLFLEPGALAPGVNRDFHAFVQWDRTDPAHRWNEAYTSGPLRQQYVLATGHVRVDVESIEDGSQQKTIRSTATFAENRFGVTQLEYAARTVVGSGHAIVNAQATGGDLQPLDGTCVSLEGCAVDDGGCSGIDSSTLDFLSPAEGTEAGWPADFPATPTF